MNSKRLYSFILVAVLTFTLSFGAVFAQEATDMVTCDADLILNLYIAERYFGFSSFNSQMPADMMIDLDSIDKGQFGLLFDAIDPNAATLDISDTTRADMTDMMAMSDEEFEEQMTGMMAADAATLPAATVSGEPEECAALRAALHRFFTVLALNDVDMAAVSTDDGDTGTGGGSDTASGDTQAGVIAITLSGANEVPGPGDDDGSGTATIYLRTASNEVCVDISVQNIALPATAAHIHEGAAGVSGPPVVTLNAPGESGVSNTCTTVEATLMTELVNNPQNYYVNVHNAEFPDGAVRGQLTFASAADTDTDTDTGSADTDTDTSEGGDTQEGVIAVTLSGANEVPGPGDDDASGTATVYLRGNTSEVCVDISVQNITLPATAAHIHQGAAGESGPPVVTLNAPDAAGLSNTCVTIEDAALMQELINNPQNFYINVHNADFPDGAARGQLQ